MNFMERVIQVRKELLVSLNGEHLKLRNGYFLSPCSSSIICDDGGLPSNAFSNQENILFPPPNVDLIGWRGVPDGWKKWVKNMHSLHENVWKEAGIHDAIMNSVYLIRRNEEIILSLAAKFCPQSNTFVFPWGEAAITLEDVMVLGGFSVLGSPIFSPIEDTDLEATIKKRLLEEARREVNLSSAKKVTHCQWINKFSNSNSVIQHEAFLALWLSRFVFPSRNDTVPETVLQVAVHLAKGKKIALAPAVLANLYSSFRSLKEKFYENVNEQKLVKVKISALFQLVQVWAWERFSELRPQPNPYDHNQPWFSKWAGARSNPNINLRTLLANSETEFNWLPYTFDSKSLLFFKLYEEDKNDLPLVAVDMEDEQIQVIVRCLRVSELVGLHPGCIEHYFPNRVAMQFGLDQDIPGRIEIQENLRQTLAWENYIRPINDSGLMLPSTLDQPCVTVRYLSWWKNSVARLASTSTSQIIGNKRKPPSSMEEMLVMMVIMKQPTSFIHNQFRY